MTRHGDGAALLQAVALYIQGNRQANGRDSLALDFYALLQALALDVHSLAGVTGAWHDVHSLAGLSRARHDWPARRRRCMHLPLERSCKAVCVCERERACVCVRVCRYVSVGVFVK